MSWLSRISLPLVLLVLHCSLLVRFAVAINSKYLCSSDIYGSPILQDCAYALNALPEADAFFKYYVEPQLLTAPPDFDWQGWADRRPSGLRRDLVQIPKFWSYGSCNLALTSYVEGNFKTALSLSRWANVYLAAYNLAQKCLRLHSQGGAATVIDFNGRPTLTMFLWRTGTSFDTTMNKYTSAAYPAGIDPRHPAILRAFGTFNSSVDTVNGTIPEGIDLVHPMSLVHPKDSNSSSGSLPKTSSESLLTEIS